MANCSDCGAKLGLGKSGLCGNCTSLQAQRVAEDAANRLVAEQADYDGKVAALVAYAIERIDSLLSAEGTAYLYRSIHLDVDSMMETMAEASGMDMFDLTMAGADGWETVAVIPRTYSGSQTYVAKNKVTATSWGGGSTTQRVSLSGNVVGAYLLMRLPVTTSTRSLLDGAIRETLAKNTSERLGPRPA